MPRPEIGTDLVKMEPEEDEMEDMSMRDDFTWTISGTSGIHTTTDSNYGRPYKTTSHARRSRGRGGVRLAFTPMAAIRSSRGRGAERGRGRSPVLTALRGRPPLTTSRGRPRGRGRGGRGTSRGRGIQVPIQPETGVVRLQTGRPPAPHSGAIEVLRLPERDLRVAVVRDRLVLQRTDDDDSAPVPTLSALTFMELVNITGALANLVEKCIKDGPEEHVSRLRTARCTSFSWLEIRLQTDAQDDIRMRSAGEKDKSKCDALPGGPTPPAQPTVSAVGDTPCGSGSPVLPEPTSDQDRRVPSSPSNSPREIDEDDPRATVERLLRAGSPRVTLRDHTSAAEFKHRSTSYGWICFQHVVVDGKEEDFVACKECQNVLHYKSVNGTSSMRKHSASHAAKRSAAGSAGGQIATTDMSASQGSHVFSGQLLKFKANLATAASKCCYMDMRPYHSIQGDGFKQLAETLINIGAKYGSVRAEDVLPSESVVARYTTHAAEELRDKLKSQLKEVKTTIGVTTDLWKRKETGALYATVTAQYVDDSFTLHSGVLATKLFAGKHINSFTTEVLESFGIDVSKCQLITDSASNNVSAFRSMGFLSCAAHNINLVLSNTFDEMSRDFSHKGIDETLQSCTELVTYMKRSGLNSKLTKKLVQQVDTCWNSKLAMLRSVAEAFPELLELAGQKEVRDCLLKMDLDLLKELVQILEPFREASEILQAENEPTLHLVVKCANKLRRGLQEGPDDTLDVQLLKKLLSENIHRLRIEPLHLAAHALQPDWRQKSYGDWADVREGHRVLLARATGEAASLTSEQQVHKSHSERVIRVRTNTFLDSDSDSSDVESEVDGPTPSELAVRARRELDAYLLEPGGEAQDILSYWRGKESELPLLAKVARSILAIPASNMSSGRSLSTAGREIVERRTRLSPNSVDELLFLNSQAKREL